MMPFRSRVSSWIGGGVVCLGLLAIWASPSLPIRSALREGMLDRILPLIPSRSTVVPELAIVDIDRAALDRYGPWPWSRARLAEVVAAVAAARPAAIVLDMLLDGPDRLSASALLDLMADPARRQPLAEAIAGLADGDTRLRDALSVSPSVLGFGLETGAAGQAMPTTPILLSLPISVPQIWRADGLIGPNKSLLAAAQGLGMLAAAADPDGPVRRIPLLVLAGGALRPGLAVEAVRILQGASALLIEPDGKLQIGDVSVMLGVDANLRLVQPDPSAWAGQTIAASQLLERSVPPDRLAGRLVLIGSSAPELGGLRGTPASPVTPSVQIQAQAIAALLRGDVAYRPYWLGPAEMLASLCIGVLCLLFAFLRPAWGVALTILLCAAWGVAAAVAVPALSLLIDPVGPPLLGLIVFGTTALGRFAGEEWRARLLRVSFEQHLSPEVVKRIAADPNSVRLKGEMCEITAVFGDIEGFTAMTERADPVDLVALLDAYFDALTTLVIEHGGMVDKIVGDGIHAMFNAPYKLADHPARAVSCSLAMLEAAETIRRSSLGSSLALGRTRLGIETGMAIVGDIGGSRKLDYTALGNAVNTAARLEAVNKELGSSICIGPGTAARIDPALLTSLGVITLRGQSQPLQVYTLASLRKPADL
jgi:adenylate cyclase